MYPVKPCRISQKFAAPGRYASSHDAHGPAGHHTGVDFGSAWPIPINGRKVRSVLPGEVVISEYNSTMGNWVGVYNHQHNLLVTYWHMRERKVKVGDWVQVMQVVGRVGDTGNSTAPHLHVQANWGRSFSYHAHIHPGVAFKGNNGIGITRRRARKIFRRHPRHPEAPGV